MSYSKALNEVTITIEVNGERRSVADMTVQEYLNAISINSKRVAVELNREILAKSAFETTRLIDGDRVEIVHFVGGG